MRMFEGLSQGTGITKLSNLLQLIKRWMPPGIDPTASRKENQGVVHIKRNDRRPANRCQANEMDACLIPSKMLGSLLLARMIEWNKFTG